MKNICKIIAVMSIVLLTSCSNEVSLQEYFIAHQDDKDFVAVDVPTSLLDTDKVVLTEDEKEALTSIKKVNFLALPLKENTKVRYEEEQAAIHKIMSSDKYQTLMKLGTHGTNVVLKYQGDDDDIDEVIVFASNQEQGLALVRVLGNDMKPQNIAKLAKAIDKGGVDMGAFKKIASLIKAD